MTHPMKLAVAKAMVARQFNEWDQLDEGDHGYWLEMADAAVRALMEPDEEMKQSGAEELFGSADDDWTVDACRVFCAMLKPLLADDRQPVPGVYEPQHRRAAGMGEG